MNNKIYWIWLQNALKYGSKKVKPIRLIYKDIKMFYNASEREWRLSGLFTNHEISSLRQSNLQDAANILEKSFRLGYQVITMEDESYPEKLKNISNPPPVLYVSGDISDINKKLCISIIGTRKATPYGLQMASEISYNLSKEGTIIVSGGALGIDTAAHEGALSAHGKTIAVLGCGINNKYLFKNMYLRNQISNSGALVSEYPPDYPPLTYNFPIRNRIISGLSSGTVVIEAGKKSGSLITAKLAKEQNRDIFIIPVDMRHPAYEGSISLINNGAKIVTCAKDLLDEYNIKSQYTDSEYENTKFNSKPLYKKLNIYDENVPKKPVLSEISSPTTEQLSDDGKKVYECIKQHDIIDINDIVEKTSIPIQNILVTITELEIESLIETYPGRRYSAK